MDQITLTIHALEAADIFDRMGIHFGPDYNKHVKSCGRTYCGNAYPILDVNGKQCVRGPYGAMLINPSNIPRSYAECLTREYLISVLQKKISCEDYLEYEFDDQISGWLRCTC